MLNKYFKLDNKLTSTLHKGYIFCLLLSLLATFMLSLYQTETHYISLFYLGYHLLRLSIIFVVEFVVCGIIVDYISKIK